MAKSRKRNRQTKFTVALEMPEGVSTSEMETYIEEAVATWRGQLDPDDPLFALDGDSVKVRVYDAYSSLEAH